jgi:hypothetical protein
MIDDKFDDVQGNFEFVREVEIETLVASQQLSSGAYGNYIQSTGLELG